MEKWKEKHFENFIRATKFIVLEGIFLNVRKEKYG